MIAYHFVRAGLTRDEWSMARVNIHENEADLLTMCLPPGDKRKGYINNILQRIFGIGPPAT